MSLGRTSPRTTSIWVSSLTRTSRAPSTCINPPGSTLMTRAATVALTLPSRLVLPLVLKLLMVLYLSRGSSSLTLPCSPKGLTPVTMPTPATLLPKKLDTSNWPSFSRSDLVSVLCWPLEFSTTLTCTMSPTRVARLSENRNWALPGLYREPGLLDVSMSYSWGGGGVSTGMVWAFCLDWTQAPRTRVKIMAVSRFMGFLQGARRCAA